MFVVQTKPRCEHLYRTMSSLLTADEEDADWRLLLPSLRTQYASSCEVGYSYIFLYILYTPCYIKEGADRWIAAFGFLSSDNGSQAEHVKCAFVSADFQYRSALLCLFNLINTYYPSGKKTQL